MQPTRSVYLTEKEVQDAMDAFTAGKLARYYGASRDQKPDRYGDEFYWGWDFMNESYIVENKT